MAYYGYGRRKTRYNGRAKAVRRKKKYTQAEKIAFRLGQEQRVKKTINSNQDTRVADAFYKGLQGAPMNKKKKSLFGK